MSFVKITFTSLSICFLTLASFPVDSAETTSKILKYDDQGRVIGFEESVLDDKTPALGSKTKPSASQKFDPDQDYEEGELLVINPPRGFTTDIRTLGYRVKESFKIQNIELLVVRIAIPANVSVPDARQQLRDRFPNVLIDANHHYSPAAGVEFPNKVARAMIRWDKAPATCGEGVRLGMIDTNIDLNHPALKGQKISFKSFHGSDRKPGPKDHGTAIASILVGTPEWGGLLPGAELFAGNMFEVNREGRKVGNLSGLLKAVSWLFQMKVDIINLSFAGADNKVMRKVFESVQQNNMIMVASVGNWGFSDTPAYPAAYKGVIGVTGIDDRGLPYAKANTGNFIDFAAPGVRVYTAAPGGSGRLQTGTSFAVPFITAMMGLEIAKGRGKTSEALSNIIKETVKDLGPPGRDKTFGWGFARHQPKC